MIGTILVPLDGSPLAEHALPEACRLASMTGARLVLVRAAPSEREPGARTSSYAGTAREAEAYLRPLQQRLTAEGFTASLRVLDADPVRAILFAARLECANLIVMSTHGRSGWRAVVLGSVAERVLQEAAIPVVFARSAEAPQPRPRFPYRRIIVPLDGSALAEGALAYLNDERLDRDTELVLVRAVPPTAPTFVPGVMRYADQLSRGREQHLMEAHQYLDDVARRYLRGKTYCAYAVVGYPAKVVLEVVEAQHIDLIVMATHGRSGLDRLVHGSVAGHILHHTQVPVLLLHGLFMSSAPAEIEQDRKAVPAPLPMPSSLKLALALRGSGEDED